MTLFFQDFPRTPSFSTDIFCSFNQYLSNIGIFGMPRYEFDTESFRRRIAPLVVKQAVKTRNRGRVTEWEIQEVTKLVQATFHMRRPDGIVEGENPDAYLDKTITAEARKYFRGDPPLRSESAKRSLLPIDLAEEVEASDTDPLDQLIDREKREAIDSEVDGLSPRDRELIRTLYGFEGPGLTVTEVAKKRGVSRRRIETERELAVEQLKVRLSRRGFLGGD